MLLSVNKKFQVPSSKFCARGASAFGLSVKLKTASSLSRGGGKVQSGFTLIDLLVSAIVIIIIFSFVLANFHLGQQSSQLDITLKQIIDGITTVRNKSLAGQLFADSFPEGGYGIRFGTNPARYTLFAIPEVGGEEIELVDGTKQFAAVEFLPPPEISESAGFLATTDTLVVGPFCYIGDYLKIIFPPASEAYAEYPTVCSQTGEVKYVGAILQHKKTGQQAYFYVSIKSGLVTSGLYFRAE